MNQVKLKMDHVAEERSSPVRRQTLLTFENIESNNPTMVLVEKRPEPLGDTSFNSRNQVPESARETKAPGNSGEPEILPSSTISDNVLVSLTEQPERRSPSASSMEFKTKRVLIVSHCLNPLDVDKLYTAIGIREDAPSKVDKGSFASKQLYTALVTGMIASTQICYNGGTKFERVRNNTIQMKAGRACSVKASTSKGRDLLQLAPCSTSLTNIHFSNHEFSLPDDPDDSHLVVIPFHFLKVFCLSIMNFLESELCHLEIP
eukprot:Gb_13506 [translate_table: standard]